MCQIQEAHPLKQGLKHVLMIYLEGGCPRIQEAHPLKQGLKHVDLGGPVYKVKIQEAHPLKQGLKLKFRDFLRQAMDDSRGTSIKTRIETPRCSVRLFLNPLDSRGTSIKTRIETFYYAINVIRR